MQAVNALSHLFHSPRAILVEPSGRVVERTLDVFGVCQRLELLLQVVLLALNEPCVVKFCMLESQKLLIVLVTMIVGLKPVIVCLCLSVALVGRAIGLQFLFVAGDNVDHTQLEVLFLQQQTLVLAMDIDELFAQFAHGGEGHRRVVDKRATLAVRVDFPTNDAV